MWSSDLVGPPISQYNIHDKTFFKKILLSSRQWMSLVGLTFHAVSGERGFTALPDNFSIIPESLVRWWCNFARGQPGVDREK